MASDPVSGIPWSQFECLVGWWLSKCLPWHLEFVLYQTGAPEERLQQLLSLLEHYSWFFLENQKKGGLSLQWQYPKNYCHGYYNWRSETSFLTTHFQKECAKAHEETNISHAGSACLDAKSAWVSLAMSFSNGINQVSFSLCDPLILSLPYVIGKRGCQVSMSLPLPLGFGFIG